MLRYNLDEVTSTNDVAKEYVLQAKEMVVVVAKKQTKGRGRIGRVWEGNESESIFCSVALHENAIEQDMNYQAMGCLAVLQAINENGNKAILKYPNDVYGLTDGVYKKVSGVLVEQDFIGIKKTVVVMGIGINVLQSEFKGELYAKATSLRMMGIDTTVSTFVEKLVDNILWKTLLPPCQIQKEWVDALGLENKAIRIKNSEHTWSMKRIERDGRLLVENNHREERWIDNGDSILYELG